MIAKNEKEAFSKRLKQQLAENGWAINSPTRLAREFNLRYGGQPISVQTASNWLSGSAIPNQDKLQILAIWLNISSQWLRFGEEVANGEETEELLNHHISLSDLPEKFSQLTTKQKFLIYHLVDEMLTSCKECP